MQIFVSVNQKKKKKKLPKKGVNAASAHFAAHLNFAKDHMDETNINCSIVEEKKKCTATATAPAAVLNCFSYWVMCLSVD